jgi:hypothetical protein
MVVVVVVAVVVVMSQELASHQAVPQLQTTNIGTFVGRTPSPLRILFLFPDPTYFAVPVTLLECYLYCFDIYLLV